MTRDARMAIARTRIIRILAKHKIANLRTLEQKISDAGPYDQRVDPHILTKARQQLEDDVTVIEFPNHWYSLSTTPPSLVQERFSELEPIRHAMSAGMFPELVGQALEIAVFRALQSQSIFQFLGHFYELDQHDDSTRYRKDHPPPALSGKPMPNQRDSILCSVGPLPDSPVLK